MYGLRIKLRWKGLVYSEVGQFDIAGHCHEKKNDVMNNSLTWLHIKNTLEQYEDAKGLAQNTNLF